jgi:hypothetical protein
MNKTLIALGVGIWGVMLFLGFILRTSLGSTGLSAQEISDILFPLMIIEIFAFAITIIGILKNG